MRADWKIVIILLTLSLLSCRSEKDAITFLDMIPFCDRIHFNAYIHRGMTEDDVIKLYGEPRFEYYFNSTGSLILKDNVSGEESAVPKYFDTGNYKIQINGYQKSPYPITHKIIVYWGGFDAIAYVYINRDGKVEKKFVGGS
jgi:hypothetical protein